eukprot:bmy_02754T0
MHRASPTRPACFRFSPAWRAPLSFSQICWSGVSVPDGRVLLRDPSRPSGTEDRRRRVPAPHWTAFPSKLRALLEAAKDYLGGCGTPKAINESPKAEFQLLDHGPLSSRPTV